MAGNHILVVDDERDIGQFIKNVAEGFGDSVDVTCESEAFKRAYEAREPDIIFLDVVMPDCDGIELMCYLAERKSRAVIYVMSGYGADYLEMAEQFCRFQGLNIARILEKPFRLSDLAALLKPLPLMTGKAPQGRSSQIH